MSGVRSSQQLPEGRHQAYSNLAELDARCAPVFIMGMNGLRRRMQAHSLGRQPTLFMFPFKARLLRHIAAIPDRWGDLRQLHGRRMLARFLGVWKPFRLANGKCPLHVPDDALERSGRAATVDAARYSWMWFGAQARHAGKRSAR